MQEVNEIIFENNEGKRIFNSVVRAINKYISPDNTYYANATEDNVLSDCANFIITTCDRDVIKGFAFREKDEKCTLVVDLRKGYDPEENLKIIRKIESILYSGKYPNWRMEL